MPLEIRLSWFSSVIRMKMKAVFIDFDTYGHLTVIWILMTLILEPSFEGDEVRIASDVEYCFY